MAKIAKVIKVCDRCDEPATTTRNISLDGKHFQIDVCKSCNVLLSRDIAQWTFVGTEIQTTVVGFMTPDRADEARRIAELRQRQADRTRERKEREAAAEKAERHARRRVPGAAAWVISNHARLRMEERGFDGAEVLRAAAQPENTYQSKRRGQDVAIHQLGNCHVIVAIHEKVVITVMDRTKFEKDYNAPELVSAG